MRGFVAICALLLGLGPAGAATPWRGASLDPGSHAAQLDAMLQHPSLRPNPPRAISPAVLERQLGRRLKHHEQGRRPSRDAALVGEATATWERLRPAILARYGVDLPPKLRVLVGGRRGFVATAMEDGSVLVNRSALELARTLARAVAAADGDPQRLLANLRVVARGMRDDKYRITFGRVNPARYRAALEGTLIGLIGHELGHQIMEHPRLDISTRARTLVSATQLDRLTRGYFGARAAKVYSGQDLVDGRPLFYSQHQEADADRISIDLSRDVGASPDGLVADLLAYALASGFDKPPVTSHPPSGYRFDDARTRFRRAGVPTIADGLTRAELRRAVVAPRAAE